MRLWQCIVGSMLGAAAMMAAGCGLLTPGESYRYRVTVEIDTPQGMRSGSSVWETRTWEGSGIPDTAIRSQDRGEAVAVDLPGGTLFALLRYADMNVDYASGVVPGHVQKYPQPSFPVTKNWKEIDRAIRDTKPVFELYPDEYPLLVRFSDINSPATVEEVNSANLAGIFGPGVRLNRITIAVTEDDVTEGIDKRLGWLGPVGRERGTLIPNPPRLMKDTSPVQRVSPGDFSTELWK